MPLTGDFRGLGQLGRTVEALTRVPSIAAKNASTEIARLIEGEFDNGLDPYGRPWKPLAESTKRSGRKPPPLTDTRHGAPHMRHGLEVKPLRGAGIAITFNPEAPAVFHQKGTKRIPARPILPTGTMPASWNKALERASDAATKRAMGAR